MDISIEAERNSLPPIQPVSPSSPSSPESTKAKLAKSRKVRQRPTKFIIITIIHHHHLIRLHFMEWFQLTPAPHPHP